jgi:hypothetical protein
MRSLRRNALLCILVIAILSLPAVAAVAGLHGQETCAMAPAVDRPSAPKVDITALLFRNLEQHAESTRTAVATEAAH